MKRMKAAVILVPLDFDGGIENLSKEELVEAHKNGEWFILLGKDSWYELLTITDVDVKEKADADESGTTTGTPEFDEGPTG